MEKLFLQVFDLSIVGGAAILMVAVMRLLLRRLPKWCSYLLWLAPAYLLTGIKPFASRVSFDLRETVGQQVTGTTFTGAPDSFFQAAQASIPSLTPTPYASVNPIQIWVFILANLWVIGMVAMLLYSLWTVVGLRLGLRGAQSLGDNVYLAHSIRTPFVMGLIRPRIYLPDGLAEGERDYILLHERTHIRRCDHIIKPLAYLLLCLHWFNPLSWLAFYLMSRDMEMSCDEAVIKKLGAEVKQSYASSLLALAAPRSIWCGSPLAFGEGHAGRRIKNLLNYKKPAVWAMALAVVLVSWMLVGMMSRTPYADGDWISQMYACRTASVDRQGEPIHKLAVLLPPIKQMQHTGSQLNLTERGGYRVTVSYIYHVDNPKHLSPPDISKSTDDALRKNAMILMSLNREVETVYMSYSHVDDASGVAARVFIRDEATRLLGGVDPWEYSGSLPDFRAFYDKLQTMLSDGRLSSQHLQDLAGSEDAGAEAIAQSGYRERVEAPIFELPAGMDIAGVNGRKKLLNALAESYLDFYSSPAPDKDWLGHTVTAIPWGTHSRDNIMLAVEYDLELRDDLESVPTDSFLTNVGNPITTLADGRRLVTGNLLYLTAQRVDDTQYALRCVTRYADAKWNDTQRNRDGVAQAAQDAVLSMIEDYRSGGLNVHTTMGEGFAPAPLNILWSNCNSILLQWNADTGIMKASVIIDNQHKLLADMRIEGEDLKVTIMETKFE